MTDGHWLVLAFCGGWIARIVVHGVLDQWKTEWAKRNTGSGS